MLSCAPSCARSAALPSAPVLALRGTPWRSVALRGPARCSAASGAAAGGGAQEPGGTPTPEQPVGVLGRIKRFFLGDKLDKEKLAQLGMGAFASYGFISNVTYGICLGIAWISFVKATGQSPLWEGQWAPFLGFYAGLWTMQNFVRPLRFSLAVFLAPVFERFILKISQITGLQKRYAFGVYLVGFAITTCVTLFGSLYLLGGFPPRPA